MAWKGLQICAISCKASRDTNQRYGLQVTPRGYKQDLLPILAIQIEDLHGMLAQQVGVRHVTQALLANLQRTSLICKTNNHRSLAKHALQPYLYTLTNQ